jgi:hypothetical protein
MKNTGFSDRKPFSETLETMRLPDTTSNSVSRRSFLQVTGTALGMGMMPFAGAATTANKKKRVAAVVTIYTKDSQTDVLIGKILEGWEQTGGPGPDLEVASIYVDQFPEGDLARDMSAKHGFPIYDSIEQAITLGQDGVISVGEHGDYPWNKLARLPQLEMETQCFRVRLSESCHYIWRWIIFEGSFKLSFSRRICW